MDLSLDLTLGMLTLGASQMVVGGLTVLFLFCSVLMILTVLIQRPQGGGLAGAFGGGGGAGGETAFGARTGDALTMATIGFFVLWLVIAVSLVLVMSPPKAGAPATNAAVSNEGPATPDDTPRVEDTPKVDQVLESDGGTTTDDTAGDQPTTEDGADKPLEAAPKTGDGAANDSAGATSTDTGAQTSGEGAGEGAGGSDSGTGGEDSDGGGR